MNELLASPVQRQKLLLAHWASLNDKKHPNVRLLTKLSILKMAEIYEKWYNKETVSVGLRKVKSEFHLSLKNAFEDIYRAVEWDIISDFSPYKKDTWKEDFPAFYVAEFTKRLVQLYGDEYAIPIVQAIREGLQSKEGWDSGYRIDVQITKTAKDLWGDNPR